MALARSKQADLEVHLDEFGRTWGASDFDHRRDPGGAWVWFLSEAVSPAVSKERSKWKCHLRQISKSWRQGGGGDAQRAERQRAPKSSQDRGTREKHQLSANASPPKLERAPEGFHGPVSAVSNFQQGR